MQAIQGFYEDGIVTLDKQAPIRKGKIIILFPEEESAKYSMSDEEAMRLFHKFSGSIDRDINFDKERDEYLNEKHGPFA
ncbi:MAG: hypothetical protein FWC77_01810 [Defluviitaleaceae bacterium]|nr:hypothetical protein [Defluviitaleaceae bacterium]